MAAATQQNVKGVHLLFQSFGGTVCDGVFLYGLFRSLPIDLTVYNGGSVQSIAALAFLGAKRRITSRSATFMIHRTMNSPQFANVSRLKAATVGVMIDDVRTEEILRRHLSLTDDKWSELNHNDLFFSGEDSIKVGFAQEVGEFSPPLGCPVYNL